jgi:hypothetical protein
MSGGAQEDPADHYQFSSTLWLVHSFEASGIELYAF